MSNPYPFAKDSALFSQAVENLRGKEPLTPENIEKEYNRISGGAKKAEPVAEVKAEVEDKPKKAKK